MNFKIIYIFLMLITYCNKNPIYQTVPKEEYCKKWDLQIEYHTMSCIPAGVFIMGYNGFTKEEDTLKPIKDTFPEHKVYLKSFWIDKYEVTFSEYMECVKAKFCTFAKPNYTGFSEPQQPMVGVNWYQAKTYCEWKGKRLPTEAEWEKSARGENGDIFPWGNEDISCEKAIIEENQKKGCGKGTTWPVGSRGSYRYGLYDMAGNSWEWVWDWYSDSYQSCGIDCLKDNPKGPCDGERNCPGHYKKVVRGGSWWWSGEFAKGYNRRAHNPENTPFHHFGFRCAVDG